MKQSMMGGGANAFYHGIGETYYNNSNIMMMW